MIPNNAVTASNMAMIPEPSARDLTARAATQSKEFLGKLNFESRMVILGNTPCGGALLRGALTGAISQ